MGAMTKDETRDSIKDLAFAVRRLALWARKAHPAPETDEMVQAVEKRLRAIAARLGSD
jgi:CHAD domain-containing protein